MQPNQIADVLSRPISQELLARDITRLAYVAKDGTPRNIPIVLHMERLRDRHVHPEERGEARGVACQPDRGHDHRHRECTRPRSCSSAGVEPSWDVVDGIPDEYLEMNGSYQMTAEQRVEWEAEVLRLLTTAWFASS